MLKINTPPQRGIDDPIMVILASDDALDHERIIAERQRLGDATDTHPVPNWLAGEQGYSLLAPLVVPEAIRSADCPDASSIAQWFKPGKIPTMFELRVLTALEWETATYDPVRADIELTRRAVVKVHNVEGDDGQPVTLDPPRGSDGLIKLAWLDALSQADREAIGSIARAARRARGGVGGEGKP